MIERISQAEKNAALSVCDMLCLPSRRESLGVVYLEAWSYGKPVIALDLPVTRELIAGPSAGLICRPHAESIARAIVSLCASRALAARLGEAGKRLIERRFNWDHIANLHQRIYQFAIQRRKESGRAMRSTTVNGSVHHQEKSSCL